MIYLDNCATTPLDPAAAEAMHRVAGECFGNPSSIHGAGRKAAAVLAEARDTLARSIQARPKEIVMTSSGTEANNLVIAGVVRRYLAGVDGGANTSMHILTSTAEHASVYNRIAYEQRGYPGRIEVTALPVDSNGRIRTEQLAASIRPNTRLITLLHCNNETGALQDLDGLATMKLRHPLVLLHLDIVQSYGKQEFNVQTYPCDFLTVSSHKVYGPKGAAFVYVRDGIEIEPFIVGGAQEKYLRAGTENVAAIAGFAAAVDRMPAASDLHLRYSRFEKIFLGVLDQERIPYEMNGSADHSMRMAGIFNLSFMGVANKEDLQIALDLEGVLLSSTSACHSGVVAESHVLKAMGASFERTCGSIRICFNKFHDENDIRTAATIIARVARRMV